MAGCGISGGKEIFIRGGFQKSIAEDDCGVGQELPAGGNLIIILIGVVIAQAKINRCIGIIVRHPGGDVVQCFIDKPLQPFRGIISRQRFISAVESMPEKISGINNEIGRRRASFHIGQNRFQQRAIRFMAKGRYGIIRYRSGKSRVPLADILVNQLGHNSRVFKRGEVHIGKPNRALNAL